MQKSLFRDNTGKLRNINLKNGTVLKDLEPHNTEIKFLIHNIELNLIATCSIDNVIKIHDGMVMNYLNQMLSMN